MLQGVAREFHKAGMFDEFESAVLEPLQRETRRESLLLDRMERIADAAKRGQVSTPQLVREIDRWLVPSNRIVYKQQFEDKLEAALLVLPWILEQPGILDAGAWPSGFGLLASDDSVADAVIQDMLNLNPVEAGELGSRLAVAWPPDVLDSLGGLCHLLDFLVTDGSAGLVALEALGRAIGPERLGPESGCDLADVYSLVLDETGTFSDDTVAAKFFTAWTRVLFIKGVPEHLRLPFLSSPEDAAENASAAGHPQTLAAIQSVENWLRTGEGSFPM